MSTAGSIRKQSVYTVRNRDRQSALLTQVTMRVHSGLELASGVAEAPLTRTGGHFEFCTNGEAR